MSQVSAVHTETHIELPNLVTLLEHKFHSASWAGYLRIWENVFFSMTIAVIICILAYLASHKSKLIPGRLQSAAEIFIGCVDDFVCGIMGHKGRRYTPFIATLFVYILFMNFFGFIPFMKSSTSSWSTTLALAICVFVYVQYTAVKELRLGGLVKHLAGNPPKALALSIVYPLMMFFLHLILEVIRPLSLSLRLRSNVWGDDMLLALLTGFGIMGIPLYLFSAFLVIIASIVQALVFCLLTAIYFALVLQGEEGH